MISRKHEVPYVKNGFNFGTGAPHGVFAWESLVDLIDLLQL